MNNADRSNVDPVELFLVRAAARGDANAQRQLFERYRDVAYAVASRITGRNEDALDAVQDGFIRAFLRLENFRGVDADRPFTVDSDDRRAAAPASFKTWLLRIVSNRSLDVLRARRVRLAVSLDSDERDGDPHPVADRGLSAPDSGLEKSELAEVLNRALETLPADQRAVFSMYAAGEMTYGEIAEALGIPIGTVMSRLYHARRKLTEQLKQLAPELVQAFGGRAS